MGNSLRSKLPIAHLAVPTLDVVEEISFEPLIKIRQIHTSLACGKKYDKGRITIQTELVQTRPLSSRDLLNNANIKLQSLSKAREADGTKGFQMVEKK